MGGGGGDSSSSIQRAQDFLRKNQQGKSFNLVFIHFRVYFNSWGSFEELHAVLEEMLPHRAAVPEEESGRRQGPAKAGSVSD